MPWSRKDHAPSRDESLPGKCATSFTFSRLGRFLHGFGLVYGVDRAFFLRAPGLLTNFTLSPFPFAPRLGRDASRGWFSGVTGNTVRGFSRVGGHSIMRKKKKSLTWRSRGTRLVGALWG